jgi:DNA-binding transcriptional MerR regulator
MVLDEIEAQTYKLRYSVAMGRGTGHAKSPAESMATALVQLRRAHPDDPQTLALAVEAAERELSEAVGEQTTYSKAVAARLMEVSLQTLDTWISRGLLPVVRAHGYKRERIPSTALIDLAAEISELRQMGRKRGLLAEAITRLQERDPEGYEHLQVLRKRASQPFDRSEYVSAKPGSDWSPED